MREHSIQASTTIFEDINFDVQFGRRRHVRYKADTSVLFIAPTHRYGEIPSLASFFPVRCKDLSRGGVSFFLPADPDFATLIVQLGNQRSNLYMEAEVVHFSSANEIPAQPAWDIYGRQYESRFGRIAVQVGCQFVKRVSAPLR